MFYGEDKVTEVFETERLLLRAPEAVDLPALVGLISNFAVAKNLATVPHPYTDHDGFTWLADMVVKRRLREDYPFSILRKVDGMYLGCCAVHPARGFELGYWLGEPFWGKGFATEAARRVARFAFEEFGTEKLIAGYMTDNPASGRVLAKLGFVYTHDENAPCLARGKDVPRHRLELTRERFEAVSVAA